jgi:hypothetical protein
MNKGNCVLTATDALFALHCALVVYNRDTLRYDGEVVARESITKLHGRGVAALTMRSLAELRLLIVNEMHEAGRAIG